MDTEPRSRSIRCREIEPDMSMTDLIPDISPLPSPHIPRIPTVLIVEGPILFWVTYLYEVQHYKGPYRTVYQIPLGLLSSYLPQ